MRVDLYTKVVLTIIAVMLTVIGCKSSQPFSVAAEGPFSGVQFSVGIAGISFFDTKTGDIWIFSDNKWLHNRVVAFGKPLAP
jgi:hypothetical protein